MRSSVLTSEDALTKEAPPTNGGGADMSKVFLSTLMDSTDDTRAIITTARDRARALSKAILRTDRVVPEFDLHEHVPFFQEIWFFHV